jgi:DNA-binding winged helix-turn-helix (wHTH) protein
MLMITVAQQLTSLCRVLATEASPASQLETLTLLGRALQQAIAGSRVLFYLTPLPPPANLEQWLPCPARGLAPDLFCFGLPPHDGSFGWVTDTAHAAPLAGADGSYGVLFVEKAVPFKPWEEPLVDLVALQTTHQLAHLARRTRPVKSEPGAACPLHLDRQRNLIWLDGTPLRLSRRERTVLDLLVQMPNETCPRERLAQAIYVNEGVGASQCNTRLDSLMARLRAKFKRVCPGQVVIETVLGQGYRLKWVE